MKMSKKSKIVIYILLGLVAIYFLAPFIYMLFSAFKTEGEAIAYPPKLLPAEWHFENFINCMEITAVWNISLEFNSCNSSDNSRTGSFMFTGCLWICKI